MGCMPNAQPLDELSYAFYFWPLKK